MQRFVAELVMTVIAEQDGERRLAHQRRQTFGTFAEVDRLTSPPSSFVVKHRHKSISYRDRRNRLFHAQSESGAETALTDEMRWICED